MSKNCVNSLNLTGSVLTVTCKPDDGEFGGPEFNDYAISIGLSDLGTDIVRHFDGDLRKSTNIFTGKYSITIERIEDA